MAPKASEPGNYFLRGIDPALWDQFSARAGEDGITMRAAILHFVRAYVEGRIAIAATSATRSRNV